MAQGLDADTLSATRWWRPVALPFAATAIVVATACVLGLFVLQGPLPALVASGAFTLAVGAVAAPRAFRIAAYVGLVALPFIVVWPALRPDDYSYPVYFAAALLGLVLAGAAQPRMFVGGLGTLSLAYLAVAAAIVVLPASGQKGLTTISYILAAFSAYTLVRRAHARERRLFVNLIVILGAVQAALALTQSTAGWPVFSVVMPELAQSERNYFAYLIPALPPLVTQGSGTFYHFNYLGALLAACLPLALGLWLSERRSWWRLALFLLIAAGLIATFSRAGLLGAIAGSLLVMWYGPTRSKRANVTLVVALILLGSLFSVNVFTRYYESTEHATIRLQTWRTAVDDALDRPSSLALGYGFGHFQSTVLAAGRAGQAITQQSTFMSSLHSSHLQLLLEFGLIGFALCAAWVVTTLRHLCRATPLMAAAVGGSIGILISQALDNALFSFVGVIFTVLMAVAEGESADGQLLARGHSPYGDLHELAGDSGSQPTV